MTDPATARITAVQEDIVRLRLDDAATGRLVKNEVVYIRPARTPDQRLKAEVLRVDGDRVYVSNLNLVKRHTKPNPQAGQAGGVVEREAPIHISNVMLFNPATGKGERVATKVLENGKRIRVFRSSGEAI